MLGAQIYCRVTAIGFGFTNIGKPSDQYRKEYHHKKKHKYSLFVILIVEARVLDPDWILIQPGFNQVSGSGSISVFGIWIWIQEGKNDPQK
jgi:hypothetical protein